MPEIPKVSTRELQIGTTVSSMTSQMRGRSEGNSIQAPPIGPVTLSSTEQMSTEMDALIRASCAAEMRILLR